MSDHLFYPRYHCSYWCDRGRVRIRVRLTIEGGVRGERGSRP